MNIFILSVDTVQIKYTSSGAEVSPLRPGRVIRTANYLNIPLSIFRLKSRCVTLEIKIARGRKMRGVNLSVAQDQRRRFVIQYGRRVAAWNVES